MQVIFLYRYFLDAIGNEMHVGGVETYLWHLTRLCVDLGWNVRVFQIADQPFEKTIEHIRVHGVAPERPSKPIGPAEVYRVAKNYISDGDVTVFGADFFSVPTADRRSIAIQHGVGWDLPCRYITPKRWRQTSQGGRLWKIYVALQSGRLFDNCPNRVCVDCNFLNWYRTTISDEPLGNIWVIPNFSELASPDQVASYGTENLVRVLFARRFTEYRGTRLFASAILPLLSRFPQIRVTFAGEGADEKWLRQLFGGEDRVSFIKYRPYEALKITLQHDISVVPSLGSEGTSFSVAEAMGAGRAVVATNVGGITNMIIHGYNGLLVTPRPEELSEAIQELIVDAAQRRQLGERGYQVACSTFNLERWRNQWTEVLYTVAGRGKTALQAASAVV